MQGYLDCRHSGRAKPAGDPSSKPYHQVMTVSIQESSLPPGQGFRFAVGSTDGPKSTVHRIWTAKNSSDIYLAGVPTAGTMKISLHESGHWQHSFLSNVAMEYVSTNVERHVDKWQRPNCFMPGWTRCYCITVPRTELRHIDIDGANVRWAEDPGHGYWVNLEVVLRDPGVTSALTWDEGILLGNLMLKNNGSVTVFARRYKPTPVDASKLARYRDFFLGNEEIRSQFEDMDTPVVGLFGYGEDGVRGVTELSMSEPPSEVRVICTGMDFLEPLDINFKPFKRDVTG
jgi:hypothetical protein